MSLRRRAAVALAIASIGVTAHPALAQQKVLRAVMNSDLKIIDPIWTTA